MIITKLLHEDFEHRIQTNSGLLIIEFWNEESGNCDIMEPVFQKLAKENINSLGFFRMHVDQDNVIPKQLNLAGVPSYALYKNETLLEVVQGITPYYKLQKMLSASLS